MNKDRILLVKGCAGLGNRILCLLTACLYARLSKRRLIVDWRDPYYSNDGSNVFDKFYHCTISSPLYELPDTDSIAPPVWRNHLRESVLEMSAHYGPQFLHHPDSWSQCSIDLSELNHQADILVMWSYFEQVRSLRRHFSGDFEEFRHRSTKVILRQVLADNLRLNPSIQKRIDMFKANWEKQRTVGVHIRYTDKKSRVRAMCRKVHSLIKHEPDMHIFLATDNLKVKEIFENRFPRVLTTPKYYPEPGTPMHHPSACPDQLEHGIEALIDMYLLAECDCLVLDESSAFAYTASLLTKKRDVRICNFQHGRWIPPDVRHWIWISMRKLKAALFLKKGDWQLS
jgi:hypothetical protein